MVRSPALETFTTFAAFAKFAKFANFDFALEHPPLIHHHPLRLRSVSERAAAPLPAHRAGYPLGGGWGEGFLRGG